jgi:hypothetical protein
MSAAILQGCPATTLRPEAAMLFVFAGRGRWRYAGWICLK